jgi:hypothetical protein
MFDEVRCAMSAIGAAVFLLAMPALEQSVEDQLGREWLRPPSGTKSADGWIPVPATDVYEVVASKEIVAVIHDLTDERCVPLSEEQARYFTGHYYRKEGGTRSFLVMAVYGQGGTGEYTVSRRGDDLLVSHGSLGRHSAFHRSALVVNLDLQPQEVFVTASIDQ